MHAAVSIMRCDCFVGFRQCVVAVGRTHLQKHLCLRKTHRDVKPANLMLLADEVTIKLIDFGFGVLGPDHAASVTGNLHTSKCADINSQTRTGANVCVCARAHTHTHTHTFSTHIGQHQSLECFFDLPSPCTFWRPTSRNRTSTSSTSCDEMTEEAIP